jgi:hypothetical protein
LQLKITHFMTRIKKIWLYTVSSFVCLGLFGIALMLIGSHTAEWECKCNVLSHWSYSGSNGMVESEKHFDAFRHSTSCKRVDWPIVVLDKVFGFI